MSRCLRCEWGKIAAQYNKQNGEPYVLIYCNKIVCPRRGDDECGEKADQSTDTGILQSEA